MQRSDALKALDIYRRVGMQVSLTIKFSFSIIKIHVFRKLCLNMLYTCQAERLSEFYEICRNLDIGRGEKFIKVEQVG
jgi:hypothetical protein